MCVHVRVCACAYVCVCVCVCVCERSAWRWICVRYDASCLETLVPYMMTSKSITTTTHIYGHNLELKTIYIMRDRTDSETTWSSIPHGAIKWALRPFNNIRVMGHTLKCIFLWTDQMIAQFLRGTIILTYLSLY